MNTQETTPPHDVAATDSFTAKKFFMVVIGVAAIAAIVAGAYFIKVTGDKSSKNNNDTSFESAVEGTIPSLSNNPLEGKPNLNPAENTNPLREVKINPFE